MIQSAGCAGVVKQEPRTNSPGRLDLAAPGRNATAVIRKDFDEITKRSS
jgi:hypothetical protein